MTLIKHRLRLLVGISCFLFLLLLLPTVQFSSDIRAQHVTQQADATCSAEHHEDYNELLVGYKLLANVLSSEAQICEDTGEPAMK
jgi:hypothetical protein